MGMSGLSLLVNNKDVGLFAKLSLDSGATLSVDEDEFIAVSGTEAEQREEENRMHLSTLIEEVEEVKEIEDVDMEEIPELNRAADGRSKCKFNRNILH
jgi:hypothetical protein